MGKKVKKGENNDNNNDNQNHLLQVPVIIHVNLLCRNFEQDELIKC